jgi:hypothetical protein
VDDASEVSLDIQSSHSLGVFEGGDVVAINVQWVYTANIQ